MKTRIKWTEGYDGSRYVLTAKRDDGTCFILQYNSRGGRAAYKLPYDGWSSWDYDWDVNKNGRCLKTSTIKNKIRETLSNI